MKNYKILILISSYLIRKSVLSVLYENFSSLDVIFIDPGENDLRETIIKENADIILLEVTKTIFPDVILKNTHFIGISINNNETEKNIFFDEILYIEDSQETIIRKFQNVLSKIQKAHQRTINSQELSNREKEILTAIAQGFTNQEIAEKFFLSIHTITTHRKNITAKLGIKTISGLTLYALLNGLVDLDKNKFK